MSAAIDDAGGANAEQYFAIIARLSRGPATAAQLEAACEAPCVTRHILELIRQGCPIEKQLTEQTDQAGRVRHVVIYSLRTTPAPTAPGLQLAYELFTIFLEKRGWVLAEGNAEITPLVLGGDDVDPVYLPGETIEAIRANLKKAIELASVPAPMPAAGRDRELRKWRAEHERNEIVVYSRVALALIDGDHGDQVQPHDHGSHDAGAVSVLAGIHAMAAAFLAGGQ